VGGERGEPAPDAVEMGECLIECELRERAIETLRGDASLVSKRRRANLDSADDPRARPP